MDRPSERAKRDRRPIHALKALIILFTTLTLISYTVIIPKQAKANPAIAVPWLVAAASAAGLTLEQFAFGMTAIIAGTTGIALAGSAEWHNYPDFTPDARLRHWNTPGWKDWDDLTSEEKINLGVTDNWDYYLRWLQSYALYYGLITTEQTNPDPDNNEPPEDININPELVRNIRLLVLSTGGLALADQRIDTTKSDYLFGAQNLNIPYHDQLILDGYVINFAVENYPQPSFDKWFLDYGTIGVNEYLYTFGTPNDEYLNLPVTCSNISSSLGLVDENNLYMQRLGNDGIDYRIRGFNYRNNSTTPSITNFNNYNSFNVVGTRNNSNFLKRLNALYAGTYIFNTPNGSATFTNNHLETNLPNSRNIEYGQYPDTPEELKENVPSMVQLNQYLSNVDNGLPEGQSYYITMPNLNEIENPSYDDFVQVRNDNEVSTDPDNPINPNPNPDDTLTPPSDEDFRQRFSRIIAQPFEAAFPFCLIEDARQLFIKLDASANAEPDFTVDLPLQDFNVDGANELEIDASDLSVIGGYVKIVINILWVSVLIGFAYRLFLKRGE